MLLTFLRGARALLATAVVLASAASGCAGVTGKVDAELARAQAQANWKMQIEWVGSDVEHALERLDIYLVDPDYEDRYPESFDLYGENVRLVGTFPMDLRAGYGAEFDKLVGHTVTISERGGDAREPTSSFVRLAGMKVPVTGGSITFDKLSGKWAGSNGDLTLSGTLELQVAGADGPRSLNGTFAVHAVTWG